MEGLPELLWGCVGTLGLSLAGMALALIIGVGGVMSARIPALRWLRWLVIAFIELIRNTPFLVQIFFFFFALPLLGSALDPTLTAIIAIGVNGGAYATEIIRGGIESIHEGQVEAGLALSLHKAPGVPADRAEAGAEGDLPVADQPVHPADADRASASAISAYDLTSVARHRVADLPQLRGLFHRHADLPRDLLAAVELLRRDLAPLFNYPTAELRHGRVRPERVPASCSSGLLDAAAVADRLRRRRHRRPAGRARAHVAAVRSLRAGHGRLYRACSRARRC